VARSARENLVNIFASKDDNLRNTWSALLGKGQSLEGVYSETARGEGLPVYELNYPFPDDRLARTHGMDVPQLTGGREDRGGSSQVELCRCLEGASLYSVPLSVFLLCFTARTMCP
jgi:hypothetical protein